MTGDNRRSAIGQELRQGASALMAARALRDLDLYNYALSRLYYARFHAITALLLTEGVEPRPRRAPWDTFSFIRRARFGGYRGGQPHPNLSRSRRL